ncbi:MAG: hypothetical protein NVS1B4_10420 [Gemmatimonadaceae bacterium]
MRSPGCKRTVACTRTGKLHARRSILCLPSSARLGTSVRAGGAASYWDVAYHNERAATSEIPASSLSGVARLRVPGAAPPYGAAGAPRWDGVRIVDKALPTFRLS